MNTDKRRAVFLDRDGVLIEDIDLLTRVDQLRLLAGVPEALTLLVQHHYKLVVVTNQPVVARGMVTESDILTIHQELSQLIANNGGPAIDTWYFCPHHPNATLPEYRLECECRKPRAGMLTRAAREHGLDLAASWLVGDRMSDIIAGHAAGCRTIQVMTGKHAAAPITTVDPIDESIQPDYVCESLLSAAHLIVGKSGKIG